MNGDGTPDLVRIGLQIDGLKVKGDGKIEVTLLDANRQPTGAKFTADNFVVAEEIGLMSTQLMAWSAGRPDITASTGTDLGAIYCAAVATGALPLMKEAKAIMANVVGSMLGGAAVNLETEFERTAQINTAFGSTFDAELYLQANADVDAWAKGDPLKAAIHYIVYGRAEGRTLRPAVTTPEATPTALTPTPTTVATPAPRSVVTTPVVAPPLVIAPAPVVTTVQLSPLQQAQQTWLAGYTDVGQSLAAVNGTLRAGQMLVSAIGKFVTIMQTDNNLVIYELRANGSMKKGVWNSGTGGTGNGGFAVMQADGNLVVCNAANTPVWNSGTATAGVFRAFTLVMQDDGNLVACDAK